ncbi:phosphate propanoyltransferase [Anaerocolumna cellulosilytica]|uniref:Phosphate propanoyltransferase n=1 Tax=Anaerocolumna cellulosilytica TaxID=433286 RepID=A0A6S6R3I2_9FIRM|nr:phosphate propanoyltransferase [Anaerocolumna cellulosilytica]MBB5194181.1 putative phosphotransacetylase [Anaerocolumna cellulosilytica]BCJ94607.1 phosphate propanoyltransferase [Anaerocolumna cellulosilytica]
MEEKTIEMITKLVRESVQEILAPQEILASQESSANQKESSDSGFIVPIGVSARHVHLTQEHVETLFGSGYELTKKKELMGGQYASNELVTIVGLKLRALENVRILGPVRKASQVEVSATDAIKLGIKAPIRESGDIEGSAPIAIVGPKGVVYLQEGCIIAKRHIHMSPVDAKAAGVINGDVVSVRVENERGTTFNHVSIRVDKSFTLEMHIDTDEANASKISTGDTAVLIK